MKINLVLVLISIIPYGPFRRWLYRVLFGYNISKYSRIGFLSYVESKSVRLENATIGAFNLIITKQLIMKNNSVIRSRNRIKNLNSIQMEENSTIYKYNFIGGPSIGEEPLKFELQNLELGKNSDILRGNYFDLVRPIVIGENVVFGGEGSEIWTHGFDSERNMLVGEVQFGNNIFIGSGCIFTKNVFVDNNITIGPGSVIYKSIYEPGFYTTHQILKVK